jgi:hypothetical protein
LAGTKHLKKGWQAVNKIAFLALLAASIVVYANDTDTNQSSYCKATAKRYSNYIGFAGGFVTGYGISYRKWFGPKWGLQLNVLPFYKEDKYPGNDTSLDLYSSRRDSGYSNQGLLSLGLTCLRSVGETKYVRFAVYAGANLQTNYHKYDYYETDSNWDSITYYHRMGRTVNNTLTVGGGFGPEFFVWRFAFDVMLGLRGSYAFEDKTKSLLPSIEGGIHFRF